MSSSPKSRSGAYTRVLLGTDFTAGAEAAADRTALLPLATSAEITLLHVLPTRPEPALRRLERNEAHRRLRREAVRLSGALRRRGLRAVEVRPVLATGEPVAEIVNRSAGVELVVVGREGERRFRDLLLGTTAERIIRHASTPVLIVRRPARGPYRRPLVAVGLSERSRSVLEAAVRMAGPGARALEVTHGFQTAYDSILLRVGPPKGVAAYHRRCRADAQASVGELVRASGMAPEVRAVVLRRGDPRTVVLAVARSRKSDLVVVGTHGRSGVAQALLGSIAEGIVRHAPADVLAVGRVPSRAARRGR